MEVRLRPKDTLGSQMPEQKTSSVPPPGNVKTTPQIRAHQRAPKSTSTLSSSPSWSPCRQQQRASSTTWKRCGEQGSQTVTPSRTWSTRSPELHPRRWQPPGWTPSPKKSPTSSVSGRTNSQEPGPLEQPSSASTRSAFATARRTSVPSRQHHATSLLQHRLNRAPRLSLTESLTTERSSRTSTPPSATPGCRHSAALKEETSQTADCHLPSFSTEWRRCESVAHGQPSGCSRPRVSGTWPQPPSTASSQSPPQSTNHLKCGFGRLHL